MFCAVYLSPPPSIRLTIRSPLSRAAGDNEVAPEGLGAGAPRRRELAHKRPPGGAAHEDRVEKAGVHGCGVPCVAGDRGVLVPDDDDDDGDDDDGNISSHENSEKNGKG